VLDPIFLSFTSNWATVEVVDSDQLVPVKQLLVVDGMLASLKEVVLVGVIVLDLEEFPLGVLLAKEGASMANHFLIEMLVAQDKDLHIVFGRNHVIKDEFLEMDKRVFAFELEGGFLNREDLAILDEEVSERCD
jgi:hypothetical protein